MADINIVSVRDCDEDSVVDVDKLLPLVEAKPEIYDVSRRDYHNQDAIAKAWQHIGQAMDVPAADCKTKWYTLRSSYARYLRERRKMRRGRGGKKKKWHLADAMSFLMPFMGRHKKPVSQLSRDEGLVGQENLDELVFEYQEETVSNTESALNTNQITFAESRPSSSSSSEMLEEVNPKVEKKAKTAAEVIAEPMAAYLKSLTNRKPTNEHPMVLYFKGLLPEIERLSSISQRRFKMDVLQRLNYYLDIEEGVLGSSILSCATSGASYRYLSDEGVAPEEADEQTILIQNHG